MDGILQFLGTGASTGIPMVGCGCPVCRSTDPRNTRLRTSARLRLDVDGRTSEILVDVTPDFRQQALRYKVSCPDAILLTHTHYDHVGGLEELRAYAVQDHPPIRCYLSASSFDSIQKLLYYHFTPKTKRDNFFAQIDFHILEGDCGTFTVDSLPIHYFSYRQGEMPVTGYRLGGLAYVTDIKSYDESLFDHTRDLDILVLSALRFTPSTIQMTMMEALDLCTRIQAKKTYLIHLSHEIDHATVEKSLPPSVALAYDALELDFHI